MIPLRQRIEYRARYWWRVVCRFLGLCPKCRSAVNYTSSGRPICPACGR